MELLNVAFFFSRRKDLIYAFKVLKSDYMS